MTWQSKVMEQVRYQIWKLDLLSTWQQTGVYFATLYARTCGCVLICVSGVCCSCQCLQLRLPLLDYGSCWALLRGHPAPPRTSAPSAVPPVSTARPSRPSAAGQPPGRQETVPGKLQEGDHYSFSAGGHAPSHTYVDIYMTVVLVCIGCTDARATMLRCLGM